MLGSKFIFSAIHFLAFATLVLASNDRESLFIKQNDNCSDSVTLQPKYDSNSFLKNISIDSSGCSDTLEGHDSFELLKINKKDLKKKGVLKALTEEDWENLLEAVNKALQVEDKFTLRLDLLQDIFSKFVLIYPDMTLFEFQKGIVLSVGQYLNEKRKPLFDWKGNIDFQNLKLPENPNTLLLMESVDYGFMWNYNSFKNLLKEAFDEYREKIKNDKVNSTYIDLARFEFILLDDKGMILNLFEDFASKMFIRFGSSAKPYIDRGFRLYSNIRTYLEKKTPFVSKNNFNFRFTQNVQTYMQNVLADPRQEVEERSFTMFDQYKFSCEDQARLQKILESFYVSESKARKLRLKLKN